MTEAPELARARGRWSCARVRTFLPMCALALLSACASSTTKPETPAVEGPPIAAYVPLDVGHAWTYAMNFLGKTGERTVTIMSKDAEGFYVDDAQGALRVDDEGLRDRQRYLLRAPVVAGNQWKAVVSASAVERYKIESVGEPCETKAGRFEDCVVVSSKLRRDETMTLHARFTWAKGIGLVKIETESETGTSGRVKQTEQSLLRYTQGSDGPGAWTR